MNKRYKLAAAIYNLSQLMRKLFGFGTPKQLAAALRRGLFVRIAFVLALARAITTRALSIWNALADFFQLTPRHEVAENGLCSTGC
ncbi:MAG: hypothetical protein DVB32_09805 [Verrucomicrobia bacterium]|nr:MAG: hypothetical protein DVB32_09805 [Verrucomicrobiota bacterium]